MLCPCVVSKTSMWLLGCFFLFLGEMVLAVKEVPESKILQHFALYKVKENDVDLISLNSTLWFIAVIA